jgi:BolA family transcriptional regulator, general stress-responsive regulator
MSLEKLKAARLTGSGAFAQRAGDDRARHAAHKARRRAEPDAAGDRRRIASACRTCRRTAGETHFRIEIVSAAFVGQSRVARQRLVYGVVADELRTRVHALALSTRTPDEAAEAK